MSPSVSGKYDTSPASIATLPASGTPPGPIRRSPTAGFTFGASGKKRGYSGAMRVTGTGTLTVTRNGEAFKTVTSADGEQTFQFFSSAALEELAFAYAPGEDDDGAALLSGFAIGNGFMVILR